MKRILLLLSLVLISTTFLIAQAPGIKWQKCIGGTGEDTQDGILKLITKNGHYIVAGSTESSDGDIDYNHGKSDVFVGEMDTLGNWIWKKTYGGSEYERPTSIQLANDSGYIILGKTYSNDGDVSGNHGSGDTWILRLNNTGDIIWQKCYGGTRNESGGLNILSLGDDGYIFISDAESLDGDVTGIHHTNDFPPSDVWVVRIDNDGNKLWDKCFGSSGEDWGYDIKQSTDGGFNLLGVMNGTDYDGTGSHGPDDAWFAKIDSTGNLLWYKLIGGSKDDNLYSFIVDNENNFILVGDTYSIDGNASGNSGDGRNPWMVKVDSIGNILWQKSFLGSLKGTDDESFLNVILDDAGNYLASGIIYSYEGTFVHGDADGWVVNISKSGNLLWEKTFGGKDFDALFAIEKSENKELLLYGITGSNDQDVSGYHGGGDIWLVKLGMVNSITGYAYYDLDADNVKDSNESLFSDGKIIIKSGIDSIVGITSNGNFRMDVDTGTYTTSFIPLNAYHNAVPATHASTFLNYNLTDTVYFAMQPIPGKKDIEASLFPLSTARTGRDLSYKVTYENIGTTDLASGTIQLIKDSRLSINSSIPNYTSVNGDTIKWNYIAFKAADTASIIINFTVASPPIANIGDTLHSYLSMNVAGDLTPENNNDTLNQIVIGSYDPNDKTESHAGSISKNNIASGDYLTYTIHFQNTGTDTAFNIIVRDTLDSKLDWNSLEMIDASNNYQLNITDGNKCAWYFNNVLLQDSNINEAASHGYIVYRIKPKITLIGGDVINNTAFIYFDYNLPVQTNTEKTVVANDVVMPLQLLSFTAQHNGKTNLLKWSTAEEINTDRFEIQRSSNSRDFTIIGTVRSLSNGKSTNDYTYTDAQPLKAINYYRLKMIDKDGKFTYSAIKNVNNTGSFDVTLYPNPVKNILTLNFNAEKTMDMQVEIVNAEGRKIFTQKIQLPVGASVQKINTASLGAGQYFIKCISTEGQTGLKFVKQ